MSVSPGDIFLYRIFLVHNHEENATHFFQNPSATLILEGTIIKFKRTCRWIYLASFVAYTPRAVIAAVYGAVPIPMCYGSRYRKYMIN